MNLYTDIPRLVGFQLVCPRYSAVSKTRWIVLIPELVLLVQKILQKMIIFKNSLNRFKIVLNLKKNKTSENDETMSTHCVVHRLLKNLSFFCCCFSVKAKTVNPRTSAFCSLSHLCTMVRRKSKISQFWNYFNLMLFSYLICLMRITFLICTLVAFKVIFITIKLTVWTCLIINYHARKHYCRVEFSQPILLYIL